MRTQAEIVSDITALEDELAAAREHEARIGKGGLAVTEYHALMCHWNHIDGCSWDYETDDDFDREGSTRYRWTEDYRQMKSSIEAVVQRALPHDQIIAVVKAVQQR